MKLSFGYLLSKWIHQIRLDNKSEVRKGLGVMDDDSSKLHNQLRTAHDLGYESAETF